MTRNSSSSDLGGGPKPRPWYHRYSIALFLGALVFALVSAPFEEDSKDGDLIEAVRLSAVMLFALPALGGRLRWGLILAVPALAGKWLNHYRPDLASPLVFLVPGLLFILMVLAQLLRFILRARRVDSEVLCAGVAGYLIIGLLWSIAYMMVARLAPDAFSFETGLAIDRQMKSFTALYFSFVTLSTVGYGDIMPVSGVARMLAMMEAMTGTFYVAILISRLVAMYSSSPRPLSSQPGPTGET